MRIAALISMLVPLLVPTTASAGNVPTSTSATYELIPEAGLIRVTIVIMVTSLIPSTTQGNVTTDYFIDNVSFGVEPHGVNFRASTSGGTATVSVQSEGEGFLSTGTVTFPGVFYGQTRSITVVYDILTGAPRSGIATRAGMAYANFCAFPVGVYTGDPASYQIVVPSRFAVEQFFGAELQETSSGGMKILSGESTPTPGEPGFYGTCVEALDAAAFSEREHISAGGIKVTTQAWPEDPAWSDAVVGTLDETLNALEERIGPLPATQGAITLREVLGESLVGYIGSFDPEISLARVSEDALDPRIAAHELAHAWFNDTFSDEIWLSEGHAEFFASEVVTSERGPCTRPDPAAMASVELRNWAFLPVFPTEEDHALVGAQYDTACWVVTEVGRKVGEDLMREIIEAVFSGEIPYLGEPEAETVRGHAATWQDWLDLADERGLLPSGEADLDWLQELLVEVGAASERALADRADTRANYHDLLDATDPWHAPTVIRFDMARWDFDEAADGIEVATQIDEARDSAVELVPEVADSDTVETAYESAGTAEELAEALTVAETEEAAATEVAAAVSAAEIDRNPIEAIGLIGEDLDASASAAVEDLVAADFDTAIANAEDTVQTAEGAALSGGLRLGGVVLAAGAIGGGSVLVRRRRRRGTETEAADTDTAADEATSTDTAEPSSVETDTSGSDTAQSDSAESETVEPDHTDSERAVHDATSSDEGSPG